MEALRRIGVFAALLTLGACTTFGVGKDIERMRNASPTGTAFTKALTEEYRQITLFEADEMYDWPAAGYFARKGLRAAGGEAVEPEPIADWKLPADKVDELTSARAQLVELLNKTARDKAPAKAAHAQGRFDCWIEQKEENHQPEHIAACRDAFYAALGDVKVAMAPPPPPPPPPPEPEPAPQVMEAPKPFVLYFAFDSAELTSASMMAVEQAVDAARKTEAADFSVTGHADRAGPAEYNLALSLRRADAVREALAARGIAAGRIGVAGRGEAEPAVPTADGVAEPANRRVEIIVLR